MENIHQEKIVRKSKRPPTHRWKESETEEILRITVNYVKDAPEQFEVDNYQHLKGLCGSFISFTEADFPNILRENAKFFGNIFKDVTAIP